MQKRHLDTIKRAEVNEAYTNNPGATMADAAKILGCSRATLKKSLARFNIEIKSGGRRSVYKQLDDLGWLEEQLSEKTIAQVARDIGATPGAVADRANRYGITPYASKTKSEAVKSGLRKRFPDGRYGSEASNWRGGRSVYDGYVWVHVLDHPSARENRIQEHRLVMEQHLGRYLEEDEIIHHIDGDTQNNDISNLELKTRAEHVRDHFKESHRAVPLRQQLADTRRQLAAARQRISELEASAGCCQGCGTPMTGYCNQCGR